MQVLPSFILGLILPLVHPHQHLALGGIGRSKAGAQLTFQSSLTHFQPQAITPARHVGQAIEHQGLGVLVGHVIEIEPFIGVAQAHLLLRQSGFLQKAKR